MIHHYSIQKFYRCQITDSVLAEVSFSLDGNKKSFLHPLSGFDAAMSYLDGEARGWFFGALEKYVNHKFHIFNTNDHKEQLANLQTCKDAIIAWEKLATNTVCQRFIQKGYSLFISVLPHPHNVSYESSQHDLNELKAFCEEYLKFNPIKAQ